MTPLLVAAILYVAITYLQDVFNTTIYLHRTMTHNGLKLHRVVASYMRVELWMNTWQTMIGWVCSHRKHHRYPDKPGDPHSPRLLGLWNLFFTHEKHYQKAAGDPQILKEFSWGIPKSKADFILERGWLGAIVGIAVPVTLFSGIATLSGVWIWWGALIGFGAYVVQLVAFLKTAAIINSFGHKKDGVGYRNFDTDDDSTNIPLFGGWLAVGECWHNNHHYDQKSPKLSYQKKEFDPAWVLVIQPLIRLGLAEQIHPTINEKEESKKEKAAP